MVDLHVILQSLLGGALIGAAAAGLLLVNGKIAGISGILSGAVSLRPQPWQWAFLAGLAAAGLAAGRIGLAAPAGFGVQGVLPTAFAGLLVGVGTRLGNGCTSGHGVCGLGNLSPRSLAATATFMAVAAAVVFATHHLAPARQLLAQAVIP
jgi:uncharacterized membrane protein YedE/YeeE